MDGLLPMPEDVHHERALLGVVDVSDERLAATVGDCVGRPVTLLTSRVDEVAYALPTMTTGGRWWVEGDAVDDDGEQVAWRMFVKLAQTATRSPLMAFVPLEAHDMVDRTLDWRVEPSAYRGELADAMPPGMRMPRCFDVVDVDDVSTSLWLEAVDHVDTPWDVERRRAAAHALGRFAASDVVTAAERGTSHPLGAMACRLQWDGRLQGFHVPMYRDPGFWEHPLVAAHVDAELRDRLLSLLDAVPAMLDEIEALPVTNAHGDASPLNLLVVDGGFVAIDWGFWSRTAVGFDLGQLVHSDVELGRSPASTIPAIRDACLAAYREGMAVEGHDVEPALLERAHALQTAVVHGVTALPLEEIMAGGDVDALVRERAAMLPDLLTAVGL